MSVYPADLKYHKEHDWVRVDGEVAVFGRVPSFASGTFTSNFSSFL